MATTRKKKIIIITGSFLAVAILTILLFSKRRVEPSPSPTPTKRGVDYKGIIPGVSVEKDVIKTLGDPLEQKQVGKKTISTFKSTSPTRSHEVSFEENTASFIKQVVSVNDDIFVEDIENEYGETEYVFYGPGSISGFNLYVYPEKGIAYLGNKVGNIILEIWYFSPTDIKTFKKTWAINYSETFTPRQ